MLKKKNILKQNVDVFKVFNNKNEFCEIFDVKLCALIVFLKLYLTHFDLFFAHLANENINPWPRKC